MKCTTVQLSDGTRAIVCGSRRKEPLCKCGSGKPGIKLCDWIVNQHVFIHGRPKTCDARLCDDCTHSPAPRKDLCPEHAAVWAAHPQNPARNEGVTA